MLGDARYGSVWLQYGSVWVEWRGNAVAGVISKKSRLRRAASVSKALQASQPVSNTGLETGLQTQR